MTRSELLRKARRDGWRVEHTNGGHLQLVHDAASHPVLMASTPGIKEGCVKDLVRMRKALPPVPAPERRASRPANKPPADKPRRPHASPPGVVTVLRLSRIPPAASGGAICRLAQAEVLLAGVLQLSVDLWQTREGAYSVAPPKQPHGQPPPFRFSDRRVYDAVLAAVVTAYEKESVA